MMEHLQFKSYAEFVEAIEPGNIDLLLQMVRNHILTERCGEHLKGDYDYRGQN